MFHQLLLYMHDNHSINNWWCAQELQDTNVTLSIFSLKIIKWFCITALGVLQFAFSYSTMLLLYVILLCCCAKCWLTLYNVVNTTKCRQHQANIDQWVRCAAGPAVPKPQTPAEKQSAVHTGHPAWRLPAPETHTGQIWGEPETHTAQWERVL